MVILREDLALTYDQEINKEIKELFHPCFFQDFLHYLTPSSIVQVKYSPSLTQDGYSCQRT